MNSKAREILDLLVRDCTVSETAKFDPASQSQISVVDELLCLAHSWPMVAGDAQEKVLDPLCRKIAIARKVWSKYDKSWKKLRDVAPLQDADWALLIGVLLAYATQINEGNELSRDVELKNLNAAMQSIDLVKDRSQIPHLGELKDWSDRLILDRIG